MRLITRGGYHWTKRYPWIVEAALKNREKRFVIDGEAVVLGVDGDSDFDALHSGRHNDEVQLCAFDILFEGDHDLRKLPLLGITPAQETPAQKPKPSPELEDENGSQYLAWTGLWFVVGFAFLVMVDLLFRTPQSEVSSPRPAIDQQIQGLNEPTKEWLRELSKNPPSSRRP